MVDATATTEQRVFVAEIRLSEQVLQATEQVNKKLADALYAAALSLSGNRRMLAVEALLVAADMVRFAEFHEKFHQCVPSHPQVPPTAGGNMDDTPAAAQESTEQPQEGAEVVQPLPQPESSQPTAPGSAEPTEASSTSEGELPATPDVSPATETAE